MAVAARVVRCWVKSRNERNLLPSCHDQLGTLERPPVINRRKVWMTSSHHAPYILGYTYYNATDKGSKFARTSKSHKPWLSSDRRLQLAYVKEESLVIAGQHTAVNTFPGLVHTARHTMEVGCRLKPLLNPVEEDVEGGADDWGEVVKVSVPEGVERITS